MRNHRSRPSNKPSVGFDDRWVWDKHTEAKYYDLLMGPSSSFFGMCYSNFGPGSVLSYLVFLYRRLNLVEEVLKPTGSLYVHCNDSTSHYIKLMLDCIFRPSFFRNDIAWRRSFAHNSARRFGRVLDHILFYTKSKQYTWNRHAISTPKTPEEIEKKYPYKDEHGAYARGDITSNRVAIRNSESILPWRGYDVASRGCAWCPTSMGTYAKYIEKNFIPNYTNMKGFKERLDALDDAGLIIHPKRGFWPGLKRYAAADIGYLPQSIIENPRGFSNYSTKLPEHTGYPTQKPIALIEKFVLVSTNEGDTVLDPFCGSGTTLVAATKHNRNVIGIDISPDAIDLTKQRLNEL